MAPVCETKRAYWGGAWHSGSGGTFAVEDPGTRTKLSDVYDCTVEDVQQAISAASKAFSTQWSRTTVVERSNLLMKLHAAILSQKDTIAILLTRENGKPKGESLAEVGMGATFFEWFAGESRRQYGEVIPGGASSKRMITFRQPLGVAALITPWNFPFAMLCRKIAAALGAGCTCVIKPSEDTPLTALYFARLCEELAVPPGVLNFVPCSRNRVKSVGLALCQSKDVRVVSFTGSTAVGQALYAQCAQTMKRLSLELGGNAPFIVFQSADVNLAVKNLIIAKFRNTGQSCIGANRIFIHERIYDEFLSKFCAAIRSEIKLGNGLEEGSNLGPVINQRQLDRLIKLLHEATNDGAKIVMGGKPAKGLFMEPTVLTDVKRSMDIVREEIFGPIAALMKFNSEEEVLHLANDTESGLAGYVFTSDISQSWRISEALEFSMVGVNESLFSTCEAPFGGIKASGFGKEGSKHGLDDFTNVKYVCMGNI